MQIILMNANVDGNNHIFTRDLFAYGAELLFEYSPNHVSSKCDLRVKFDPNAQHPVVCAGGSISTGYDVILTATGDLWGDKVYQFCHELCHILASTGDIHKDHSNSSNQWFEEAICEVASMYCLKTMAERGAKGVGVLKPSSYLTINNLPGHDAFEQYVTNAYINDPKRVNNDPTLFCWLFLNTPKLRSNPYNRDLNNVVANKLLPIFLSKPESWGAVPDLNTIICPQGNDSFDVYLGNWQKSAPKNFSYLFDGISNLLKSSV